jgi:hypothetical protein
MGHDGATHHGARALTYASEDDVTRRTHVDDGPPFSSMAVNPSFVMPPP